MMKQSTLVIALLLAPWSIAHCETVQPKPPHHHKGAVKAASDPLDAKNEAPLPEKVQKWFGDTVDDILTGADQTINEK